jgi:hypothetical protein
MAGKFVRVYGKIGADTEMIAIISATKLLSQGVNLLNRDNITHIPGVLGLMSHWVLILMTSGGFNCS